MKKSALLVCLLICFTLSACGTPDSKENSSAAGSPASSREGSAAMQSGVSSNPAKMSSVASIPDPVVDKIIGTQWNADIINEARALSLESYAGNTARLAAFFRKLDAMENGTVTIGFIGGSITQGAPGPSSDNIYASLVTKWLQKAYPHLKINGVNIGIGATGSFYGVHRVQGQLLDLKPDLVFVEYFANDQSVDMYRESYESLCRKILQSESKPALLAIGMYWRNTPSAFRNHLPVLERYEIPLVSYMYATKNQIEAGKYQWSDLSNDEVHPNAKGHEFLANLLIGRLYDIREKSANAAAPNYTLPSPVTRNRFEDGIIYRGEPLGNTPALVPAVSGAFKVGRITSFFDLTAAYAATSSEGGAAEFKIKGGMIWADVFTTDTGTATGKITVDGDTANAIAITSRVNPNIPQGGYVALPNGQQSCRVRNNSHLFVPLVVGSPGQEHTIRIEYTGGGGYLCINGFLVSQRS